MKLSVPDSILGNHYYLGSVQMLQRTVDYGPLSISTSEIRFLL